MADKEEKYLVFKLEDIKGLCDLEPQVARELDHVIERYKAWRCFCHKFSNPQYIICNQDEPYAAKVWHTIFMGEVEKNGPGGTCSTVVMPRELTAENGAKAALMGEFFESVRVTCPHCGGEFADNGASDCHECDSSGTIKEKVPVSWTTIKKIYKKAVECCQVR